MPTDLLIRRDDLHRTRIEESEPAELEPDQALLTVSSFGLSSNNVTYAVFGETMSYWDFFPAEAGWGRLPVWGFAEVAQSGPEALEEGTRVFGYFPASTHLVVTPDGVTQRGFVDASPHRANLPGAYNVYRRVDADVTYDAGHEDEHMLLMPLFFTSFLIDDFIADNDLFGAGEVVISSASSKTALAAAHLLAQREGIDVIGLTSAANLDFVASVGTYDAVVTYDELARLPEGPAVYLDMSGNGTVRDAVHRHYGERLVHSALVGDTHWDTTEGGEGDLPGPRPTFFFAPDRIVKRAADWGPDGLETRLAEAWGPFVEWTGGWLRVTHGRGPKAVEDTYRELLEGRTEPSVGHVLSMSG
jgi:NADPH:quinone reductase-like Zn-dependent oxidoreductase